MEKRYLLAPGPTAIPPEVLLKMAEPMIHHRNPVFEAVMQDVRDDLKYVFGTKNEVLLFTSSGTGAMESAVTNVLSPGDRAICIRSGKFGERWAEICRAYGVEADQHRCALGRYPRPRPRREDPQGTPGRKGRVHAGDGDFDRRRIPGERSRGHRQELSEYAHGGRRHHRGRRI